MALNRNGKTSKPFTSKFARVYPSDEINTKGHWAVGFEWSVKGKDYIIAMKDKGFTCTCPAFKKCKHIVAVEEGFL